MTILVIGSSGFIGERVYDSIKTQFPRVIAGSRKYHSKTKDEQLIYPDLTEDYSVSTLNKTFINHEIDTIIITAGVAAGSTAEVFKNLTMTKNISKACLNSSIKRVIFLSSAKVYGETSEKLIKSDFPLCPTSPYGISKLEAEKALKKVFKNTSIKLIIIRPTMVYGESHKNLIFKLYHLLKLPLPLPLGGLEAKRSLLSINNLTSFISHILLTPKIQGDFLLCDQDPVTISEVISDLRRAKVHKACIFRLPLLSLFSILTKLCMPKVYRKVFCDFVFDVSQTTAITGWTPPYLTRNEITKITF